MSLFLADINIKLELGNVVVLTLWKYQYGELCLVIHMIRQPGSRTKAFRNLLMTIKIQPVRPWMFFLLLSYLQDAHMSGTEEYDKILDIMHQCSVVNVKMCVAPMQIIRDT